MVVRYLLWRLLHLKTQEPRGKDLFVLTLLNRQEGTVILMIQIFRLLEDGAWHSLKEVAWKTRVPIEDLIDCCLTLSRHEVVEYDAESDRVRIGHELKNMITMLNAHDRVGEKWRRMGAGTVIVPPHKRFRIQGISMQNMTEQDLKLEFTFNMKPIEIVISKA
jgi:hypothetical protein